MRRDALRPQASRISGRGSLGLDSRAEHRSRSRVDRSFGTDCRVEDSIHLVHGFQRDSSPRQDAGGRLAWSNSEERKTHPRFDHCSSPAKRWAVDKVATFTTGDYTRCLGGHRRAAVCYTYLPKKFRARQHDRHGKAVRFHCDRYHPLSHYSSGSQQKPSRKTTHIASIEVAVPPNLVFQHTTSLFVTRQEASGQHASSGGLPTHLSPFAPGNAFKGSRVASSRSKREAAGLRDWQYCFSKRYHTVHRRLQGVRPLNLYLYGDIHRGGPGSRGLSKLCRAQRRAITRGIQRL